jgi:hypothetical protein
MHMRSFLRTNTFVRVATVVLLSVFAVGCDDDPSVEPPEQSSPAPRGSPPASVTPLARCVAITAALPAGVFADPVLLTEPSGQEFDLPHLSSRGCLVENRGSGTPPTRARIKIERVANEGDGTFMREALNRDVTNFLRDMCGAAAASGPADPTGLHRCSTTQPDPAVTGVAAMVSGDRWVGVQVTVRGAGDAVRRKAEEAAAAFAKAALGT